MRRKILKLLKYLLVLLILSGVAGGTLYYFKPELFAKYFAKEKKTDKESGSAEPDRIYEVKRGDMTIGVMLKGSVNAKKNYKLALQAPFSTKLVKVADENSRVKAGDVVAEYETSDLLLKIEDFRVNADQIRKNLEIALEERRLLISTNAADIRTARDNVTEANDAYKRYVQLEGPKERDSRELAISDAEQALEEAEEAVDTAQEEYDNTVFATAEEETKAKNKITSAQQKKESAETKLSTAQKELKLFKRYTYPNKLRELRNKLAQTKLSYEKEKVRTQSLLAQKNNTINSTEVSLRTTERQLERHQSWLPMMKLIAPADGIITYGDPDAPPWRKPEVKVGMDGRRNQVIITIPDMTQIIINASLPEQYRSRVSKGNEVVISPDSIREIRLKGKVERIAPLPERLITWDEGSPKIYRTILSLEEKDPRLVSGMSVQAEVISRVIHDVISVPVEAVFEEGGELFVYRKVSGSPEKTPVKIGQSSDHSVEITEGVKEGDQIYLYRPFQSSGTGK